MASSSASRLTTTSRDLLQIAGALSIALAHPGDQDEHVVKAVRRASEDLEEVLAHNNTRVMSTVSLFCEGPILA